MLLDFVYNIVLVIVLFIVLGVGTFGTISALLALENKVGPTIAGSLVTCLLVLVLAGLFTYLEV